MSRSSFKQTASMKGYSPSKISTKNSGYNTGNSNSGFLGGSRTKGMQSSNEFSRQLKSAQNQVEENVEDEFIKNLQQQIAYMELELKLLKEKELEQKQSVSQIDKFFNDGVPLNENILALKNQYNHNKKQMEARIDDVNDLRLAEAKHAADLKNKYERNSSNLKAIDEAMNKKEKEFLTHMAEMRMAYLNEKHRRLQFEKEFKRLQALFKEKTDSNLKHTRDLEREAILSQHHEETLKHKRQRTKDDLVLLDGDIVKLEVTVEKQRVEAVNHNELNLLEKENDQLNAKIMRIDKENVMAGTRVKEMNMFLEQRQKERVLEAERKRGLVNEIENIKFRIEEQGRMNEEEIKKRVDAQEDKDIKDRNKLINEVKNSKTITKQRQTEKEESIKEMAQEKMGLQQDTMALESENAIIEKELKENSEVLIRLKNNWEALTAEEKEIHAKLEPVEKEVKNMQKMIPHLEQSNEKLKEQIAHMEKLNELSLQLKNVNLEDLRMVTQSNDQVQNTITDLLRKWDFLQRASLGSLNQ